MRKGGLYASGYASERQALSASARQADAGCLFNRSGDVGAPVHVPVSVCCILSQETAGCDMFACSARNRAQVGINYIYDRAAGDGAPVDRQQPADCDRQPAVVRTLQLSDSISLVPGQRST